MTISCLEELEHTMFWETFEALASNFNREIRNNVQKMLQPSQHFLDVWYANHKTSEYELDASKTLCHLLELR